jgi:hypothetical protein
VSSKITCSFVVGSPSRPLTDINSASWQVCHGIKPKYAVVTHVTSVCNRQLSEGSLIIDCLTNKSSGAFGPSAVESKMKMNSAQFVSTHLYPRIALKVERVRAGRVRDTRVLIH